MANMVISYLEVDIPQTVISYLAIETPTDTPKMNISWLEILNTASSKGLSNKTIPYTGNSRGTTGIAAAVPQILVAWLEINTPELATRIGRSAKALPISGTAKGLNIAPAVGPIISSIVPTNGSSIRKKGKVTVTATITDKFYPITKVEMFVDGVLMARDTIVPYSFSWDLRRASYGTHYIVVIAYNSAGKYTQAQSVVTLI